MRAPPAAARRSVCRARVSRDLTVPTATFEGVGDLFVAQAVDLPQDDDRSLIERQGVQRRPESRGHFLARKRAVRSVAVARLTQLAVIEHVLFELHLIGAPPPAPPALTIARLVDGDAVNPGPERRLPAERVNGAEDPQEDFLRQIEGFVTIAQQMQGELKHHPFVAGTPARRRRIARPAAQRWISTASPVPTSVQPSAPASFTSCSAMSRDCIKSINSPAPLPLPGVGHGLRTHPWRKVPSLSWGPSHSAGTVPSAARRPASHAAKHGILPSACDASWSPSSSWPLACRPGPSFTRRTPAIASIPGSSPLATRRPADEPLQALEAYSGAIALRPDSMVAHLKRGMTYRDRGELDAALKDLRRASELDPTATLALDCWATPTCASERFDRAAERYEAYVALDDRSPRVWYKLGLASLSRRSAGQAREPLQRAVALDKIAGRGSPAARPLAARSRDSPGALAPRSKRPRSWRRHSPHHARRSPAVYAASGDTSRGDRSARSAGRPRSNAAGPLRRAWPRARACAPPRRRRAHAEPRGRAVSRRDAVYAALGRVWLERGGSRRRRRRAQEGRRGAVHRGGHVDVTSDTLTDLGRALLASGDSRRRRTRAATGDLTAARRSRRVSRARRNRRAARPSQDARDALIRYATLVGDAQPVAAVATQIAGYSIRLGDRELALRWIDRAIDESGTTPALNSLRDRAQAQPAVVRH